MKERPTNPNLDPDDLSENQLYSTAYIAEFCGVEKGTVRLWIRSGKLPAMRIGKRLRVRRRDLLNFLNSKY